MNDRRCHLHHFFLLEIVIKLLVISFFYFICTFHPLLHPADFFLSVNLIWFHNNDDIFELKIVASFYKAYDLFQPTDFGYLSLCRKTNAGAQLFWQYTDIFCLWLLKWLYNSAELEISCIFLRYSWPLLY